MKYIMPFNWISWEPCLLHNYLWHSISATNKLQFRFNSFDIPISRIHIQSSKFLGWQHKQSINNCENHNVCFYCLYFRSTAALMLYCLQFSVYSILQQSIVRAFDTWCEYYYLTRFSLKRSHGKNISMKSFFTFFFAVGNVHT